MVSLLENYFFKNIYGYIYKNLDISSNYHFKNHNDNKLLVNLPKWRAFVWTRCIHFSIKCCHNVLALLNFLQNNLFKLPFLIINLLEDYVFEDIQLHL